MPLRKEYTGRNLTKDRKQTQDAGPEKGRPCTHNEMILLPNQKLRFDN